MDERNLGQIALWKPNSDNPNAPQAKGQYTAHRDIKAGEVLDVALWRNQSDNPNSPVMKGKISDKRQPGGQQQATRPQPAQGGGFDDDEIDDLPF